MTNLFEKLLDENKTLLADGATGTNFFAMGLQSGDAPELWNTDYPERVAAHYQTFIDAGSGGTLDGMITAVDGVIAKVNARTKIIPGHGELADLDDLRRYRDMLDTVRGRMRSLIEAGKSRAEVVAAKPTADLDARWGGGFLKADAWVGIVYDSMTPRRSR